MVKTSHLKQVVKKEQLGTAREYRAIRERIKDLKKEMRQFTTGRMGAIYKIVSDIVKLKQQLPENRGIGKRFTFRSLEWEDDISLTAMEIRYIESYKYISDYGIEKVSEGLLNDSTICHFLAISSLLRQEEYQNKLIDLIIANKIKVSQVSELTKEELRLFLQGKLKKRIHDDYFFTATKTLRSIKKRVIERKHLLKDSLFSKDLKRAVIELYREIKEAEILKDE